MAIDFPNSPSTNQIFTESGKSWKWDGQKWINVNNISAADIPSASIDSSKLNVDASGSTGNVLTRNTAVTSGFEWAAVPTSTYLYTAYTPTWTQSATITKTVNWARYVQIGKFVNGSIKMTASSAGTANNKILVGLPVAASANNFIIGQMMFFDDSTNTDLVITVPCFYESSTTMSFAHYQIFSSALRITPSGAQGTTNRFGQNFTDGAGDSVTGVTVASNDVIYVQFAYEAA